MSKELAEKRERSRSPRGGEGGGGGGKGGTAETATPETQHSGSEKKCFLFVGNPGTGKSTLINGVIGSPVFKAMPSFTGQGVTFQFDQKEIEGKGVFMDTPGLSDEKLRKQAAEAITTALKQNGFYRIFFVITVEAGRVRPDDKTTMKLILDAAPTITKYCIIVNKVTEAWAIGVQKPETLSTWVTTLMEGLPKLTSNIHFMHRKGDLEDCSNVQYEAPRDVIEFIETAPGMPIASDDVAEVQADQFAEMQAKHEEILRELREDAAKMAEAAERQKEEMMKQIKETQEHAEREKQLMMQRLDQSEQRSAQREKELKEQFAKDQLMQEKRVEQMEKDAERRNQETLTQINNSKEEANRQRQEMKERMNEDKISRDEAARQNQTNIDAAQKQQDALRQDAERARLAGESERREAKEDSERRNQEMMALMQKAQADAATAHKEAQEARNRPSGGGGGFLGGLLGF